MRRLRMWLAIAIPALVIALPAGAESRTVRVPEPPPFCAPAHSVGLLSDRQSQVYIRQHASGSPGSEQLVACARGKRSSYVLGPAMPATGASPVERGVTSEALAGPILAYAEGSAARAPGYATASVIVRNLRSGQILHDLPTGSSNPPGEAGADLAPAVVVNSDGAVAWVTVNVERVPRPTPCPGPDSCAQPLLIELVTHAAVHALDKSGNRLLASGTDIEPQSLTLTGSTLSWKQGGQLVSATLR